MFYDIIGMRGHVRKHIYDGHMTGMVFLHLELFSLQKCKLLLCLGDYVSNDNL